MRNILDGHLSKHGIVLLFLTILVPGFLLAQTPAADSPWKAWDFLLGEWTGEGGGDPGQGTGGFSFRLDLQGTIIVRRNHSDFPATQDRPAFAHDDIMVVYREGVRTTKADYYDNEGHIIRYSVDFSRDSTALVFLSQSIPGAPRFRLTYDRRGEGRVGILFEMAPPTHQEAFVRYLEAVARKKQD